MTVLVTADLHLSDNVRDDYRHQFMRKLPAVLRRHNVDLLLILGDLTEEKDRHGAWLVNQVASHIQALTKVCPVIINRGNHDYVDAENPFYEWLGRFKGVTWVNVPTPAQTLSTPLKTHLGHALFLPHTADWRMDWIKLNFGAYDRIFAHNTFAGATSDSGRVLEGIPADVFPKGQYPQVISGDVHTPQRFGQIRYVGAPYTVDFGDAYEPRMILLDSDGRLKSLRCKGPQKRLVTLADGLDVSQDTRPLQPGDILKVRVKLEPREHADWPQMKDEIRAWAKKKGYVLHVVQAVMDRTARLSGGGIKRLQPKRTDDDLLDEYAKARDVDEATRKTGRKLMRNA